MLRVTVRLSIVEVCFYNKKTFNSISIKYEEFLTLFISIGLSIVFTITTSAQQWIKEMPGYERYKEIAPQIRTSVKPGQISVKWADDGKSLILPKV